ncbi:heme biosynthesis protein HemY [Thalassococcus sp. S3]|uniref:heme biosynthesis protein HemY n=1 Tax=Thalassococcus sp. S3 TaxID=2017482 RepID=UPI001024906E|nr:heme biosynthesis HemY N-terminal domain-containing protein [Thalassococcus sp. S3]QBF29636.1 heme biosynthesis protein HemY [Thalassococcus sp. S3]
MLWSLIKILLFVAIVAGLTLGAGYLLESQGGVQITVAGTEFTLGPLQSVIAAVMVVVLVWLFLKLLSLLVAVLRFLNGDETAISRYFDRNRERKGFQALSEGLMALASGEGRLAMAKAAKAEKYLEKPELTQLLTAQAAEMSGDTKKAAETYKQLISNEQTRFVGVRGIMKQKLAEGDTDTALKLAERAFALKPRHEETQDVLLKLQAQNEDWSGARATLSAKLKHGSLPRDVHKRRDAVLALSEARDVLDDEKPIAAREAAIEANRLSPDLIPAAVMAAKSHIKQGKPKYAVRILKKAWEAQPHPDLAAAFAEIEPNETPQARIKRFATLTRLKPDHPESRLLLSELHIAAEDFPEARRTLGNLVETQPDARVLTIMAAIERGEGASDAVVKGWLARALTAPRGSQWVCDNCHHIHSDWAPVCENCQSFDTLSWRTPPAVDTSTAPGMQMLPLIVGSIEDNPEDSPPEVEIVEEDAESTEDTTPGDTETVLSEDTAAPDDPAKVREPEDAK